MSQSSGCVGSTDDCDIQAAARSGEALHEVYHVAMLLRQCISCRDSTPWPPVIDDLTEESIVIPNILYNFLVWLMDGDFATGAISDQKVELSTPAMHRVVLSIAQDNIYRTTSGCVKPPKHVCLPMPYDI